jgi:NADP-dependent 3-hydroxy acid dehydrogenase YdfG
MSCRMAPEKHAIEPMTSYSKGEEVLMKLLILGATGGIGLEIVRQAIDCGHRVTAFARAAGRLKEFGERIAVIQGDVLNRPKRTCCSS